MYKTALLLVALTLSGAAFSADSLEARVARLNEMRIALAPPALSDEMAEKLDELVDNVPGEVREKFDQEFANWSFYLRRKDVSDYYNSAKGRTFEDLVAMGKDIIPLVLQKIVQPGEYAAIPLYESIQDDRSLMVMTPGAMSEREKAIETARMWLDAQG